MLFQDQLPIQLNANFPSCQKQKEKAKKKSLHEIIGKLISK